MKPDAWSTEAVVALMFVALLVGWALGWLLRNASAAAAWSDGYDEGVRNAERALRALHGGKVVPLRRRS